MTVKVAPAIVSVPVRLDPVFAATPNVTEPVPDPVAPPVMVIHDALLDAVQPQPVAAVTLLLPVPAAAVNDWLVGEIDGEHEAAACVKERNLSVMAAIERELRDGSWLEKPDPGLVRKLAGAHSKARSVST